MKTQIDRLFELHYSSILTPYNLLQNALLPNYEYIKYYGLGIEMTAEVKCSVDGEQTIFYYHFTDNNLQKIEMEQLGRIEVKFDRNSEYKDLRKKLLDTNHIYK